MKYRTGDLCRIRSVAWNKDHVGKIVILDTPMILHGVAAWKTDPELIDLSDGSKLAWTEDKLALIKGDPGVDEMIKIAGPAPKDRVTELSLEVK